jgi:hypothetical protein
MSHVHLRLISSTYIPSVPTQNIWWQTIDRGAPGRGEVLRFILVNSWLRGSTSALPFTVGEDDNLEHPTKEQEEWRTMMISFEFPRGLNNSTTTFLQPVITNPIDGPTWPPIRTPSTTTQSSGLALSEIRTTKPKESTWLGVAIGKRSIPPASTQWSTGPRRQNAASLHQVALHLSPNFSTVRPQGQTYGIDWGSHSRIDAHWAIDKQCTTTSEATYLSPISRARLAWTWQHDILIPSWYAYLI